MNAVRRLSTVVESERTLLKRLKTRLHLVLTQCADIDSRADRTSKPCLLLSCYQAVGGLRSASPALSFAKVRSNKSQVNCRDNRFRAGSLQPLGRIFACRTHVMLGRRLQYTNCADRKVASRPLCALTRIGRLKGAIGSSYSRSRQEPDRISCA